MSFEMLEAQCSGTIIKVIGVGGAGGNAVAQMIHRSVKGVDFICANTDAQALSKSPADIKLQLGESGLGAGAKPEKGKESAENERERIKEALLGSHMVFITAGMGGGTGTGAAPVVAEVAKEIGALTVAVVTKPFSFEGKRRTNVAEEGVAELQETVDSLIVILNEKLEEVLGDDVTQVDAFAAADNVLYNAVAGIAEIINVEGQVNVDFEDVKTVMSEQGKAMMGTATANGADRARVAAEQAVRSPLLEGVDLAGARGILVNISASSSLKLNETKIAMDSIRAFAAEDACVIHGSVTDESLGDELRVTVVATGLDKNKMPNLRSIPISPLGEIPKTGTNDSQTVIGSENLINNNFSNDSERLEADSSVIEGSNNSDLSIPAIWRTPRNEAAAKVQALEEGGMDPLDIPAFLRKQAD
jgi:cell division protein FtsZ